MKATFGGEVARVSDGPVERCAKRPPRTSCAPDGCWYTQSSWSSPLRTTVGCQRCSRKSVVWWIGSTAYPARLRQRRNVVRQTRAAPQTHRRLQHVAVLVAIARRQRWVWHDGAARCGVPGASAVPRQRPWRPPARTGGDAVAFARRAVGSVERDVADENVRFRCGGVRKGAVRTRSQPWDGRQHLPCAARIRLKARSSSW